MVVAAQKLTTPNRIASKTVRIPATYPAASTWQKLDTHVEKLPSPEELQHTYYGHLFSSADIGALAPDSFPSMLENPVSIVFVAETPNRRTISQLNRVHAEATDSPKATIVHGFSIPKELIGLAEKIRNTWFLTTLQDDWDGQGSPGYQIDTWRRAVSFVVSTSKRFVDLRGQLPPVPAILKGDDGDIDLRWFKGSRSILISVSSSEDDPIWFHAMDSTDSDEEFQGKLSANQPNHWLLDWLTSNK